MGLLITSLNSGSNGNCYYIGNENEAVLIDAGISCRETEKRMHRLGLSMEKVKAIFISHEHGDHIKGLEALAKKYELPVYITKATLLHSRLRLPETCITSFLPFAPISIGSLSITGFPKFHDAAEPHSFIVQHSGVTVGVFTDIGKACPHVLQHFSTCDAAFLESNYDEDMLENGRYPYHLKNRIRGGSGHLSNKQALNLFLGSRPPQMTHLFLSHLSKDNNDPDLVRNIFREHAGTTEIVIASRYQETPVFTIGRTVVHRKPAQLSLFQA